MNPHRTARQAERRRAEADPGDEVQAYACASPRCRGEITDHAKQPRGAYACVRCHARSKPPSIQHAVLLRL